jgi:hypothetical protein
MKKQMLLNAFGVACLVVLCSCGDKKAEEPKTETPAATAENTAPTAVAQNEQQTPAVEGEAKPEATTEAAPAEDAVKTENAAPADKA